ncbi:hypothetical protein M501DRAFT_990109 [Patellaria atrata CBS 101060]|uniref:Transmembrane protein n=1 Tax=Patellaria atrata CBS 101060 TaxID=1346257 RepID=A0A9P4SGX9_9PEZI|nr:hypothetical protein M501DRAFT_990109 [Patellaria atrata CBS 101060]
MSLISSFVLSLMMFWPISIYGDEKNGGMFEPVPYRFRGYPKSARNVSDHKPISQSHDILWTSASGQYDRSSLPNYLCFLREPQEKSMRGVTVQKTSQYVLETGQRRISYAYIGYRSRQFRNDSNEDLHALHLLAERAARDAGLMAYWVACSCMPDPDLQTEEVYRIDSVARNSSLMIVALNPSKNSNKEFVSDRNKLLQEFGSGLWTRPDLLNSPSRTNIKVYVRGDEPEDHLDLSKRQFANLAYGDEGPTAIQLLDHFDGHVNLTRLQLIVQLLRFFLGGQTSEFYAGDLYYVLMGLLPYRPRVDPTDSRFQALSRVILANDSDRLLERLICKLLSTRGHWAAVDDAWGVNLWEIYPSCQVSGVDTNDTLIVDGAFGASIRWNSFERVDYRSKDSPIAFIYRTILRGSPLLAVAGALLVSKSVSTAGYALLSIAGTLIAFAPFLIRWIYAPIPEKTKAQPYMFGFEGYMPIDEIERLIFGSSNNRLKWSPNGSRLSKHFQDEYEQCVGLDPTGDPRIADVVQRYKDSKINEPKVFTLVDTCTMTVILYVALQPPVAVLCCGQEGGMQRALLCSYEAGTGVLHRETVIRLESDVLNSMMKMGKVRLSLQSPLLRPGYNVTESYKVEGDGSYYPVDRSSGPDPMAYMNYTENMYTGDTQQPEYTRDSQQLDYSGTTQRSEVN